MLFKHNLKYWLHLQMSQKSECSCKRYEWQMAPDHLAWYDGFTTKTWHFCSALQGHQITVNLLQLQTGVNIVKNEGFLALYSGLGPAIGRGLFYGGQSQLISLT